MGKPDNQTKDSPFAEPLRKPRLQAFELAYTSILFSCMSLLFALPYFGIVLALKVTKFDPGLNDFAGFPIVVVCGGSALACAATAFIGMLVGVAALFQRTGRKRAIVGITIAMVAGLIGFWASYIMP